MQYGVEAVVVSNVPASVQNVEVALCPRVTSLRQMWKAQKSLIRRFDPDILHAHFIDQFALVAQWLDIPYVLTPWGSDIYFPFPDRFKGIKRKLKWMLLRRAYRKAGVVTALSPYMAKVLKERFGATSINTILLGFGTPAVRPVKNEERVATRRLRGAGEDTLIFFSPRACRPLYNTKQVVEGFIGALSVLRDVQLWVSEYNADQEYLAEIKDTVTKRGAEQAVLFLPPDTPEDLHTRLFSADVIVSVPDSDGMPVSIAQAYSQGRPVLYQNIPQLEGVIVDGVHGYGVNSIAPAEMKRMYKKIYENRRKLGEMGNRCKEYYRNLPTEQQEMARMCDIYEKLAKGERL
jgi:glycosyltransferase involved in cell wall biosynthesis